MAGSAVNLGIGGGMFSPGLGPNQQALVDSLKRRSMALGKPAINLEDPAALRAEAARLQQQGDVQGAMQMLQRAQNLEKHQQQQSDRLRDQKATLDAGGAAITKQAGATADRKRAFQKDLEARGQLEKRMAELGMNDEIEQLRNGTLKPSAAATAIRSRMEKQRTSAAAAAKAQATQAKKNQEKVTEIASLIQNAAKTDPQKAAKLAAEYDNIGQMTAGELKAAEYMIKKRLNASASSDEADSFWKPSTGRERAIANDRVEEVEDIIDDFGTDEGFFGAIIDGLGGEPDVGGYMSIFAEGIKSVATAQDISQEEAAEKVMDLLRNAEQQGITDEVSFANVIEQALGGRGAGLPPGVTEADIQLTMKNHGLTRTQVLERLNGS